MNVEQSPTSDATRHALQVSLRGCDELLIEAEWMNKLARSAATGTPLRIKLGPGSDRARPAHRPYGRAQQDAAVAGPGPHR
jgi:hypothetical protein